MKSFDEKLYICETCYKHLHKNEILCQAVCNKITLDPIPDELKDLKKKKKIEKALISTRILFKKLAIMHGKSEFVKLREEFAKFPYKLHIYMQYFTKVSSFQWINCS